MITVVASVTLNLAGDGTTKVFSHNFDGCVVDGIAVHPTNPIVGIIDSVGAITVWNKGTNSTLRIPYQITFQSTTIESTFALPIPLPACDNLHPDYYDLRFVLQFAGMV